MVSVTCPKCGFQQEGGSDCVRCGVIFDRYRPPEAPPARPARPVPSEKTSSPGLVTRFYRVFRWVMLAGALVVVILILRQTPPPRIDTDPEAPARLEYKLRRLRLAAQFRRPHTLRLDEAEINSWLEANLVPATGEPPRAASPAPPAGGLRTSPGAEPTVEEVRSTVRDLKIDLLDDRVRAYLLFDFHGKDLSLLLEGRLRVENGYLRLEPTRAQLGSLPVPRAALDRAVRRLFTSQENREKFRLPPEIRDVRIENGKLVVSYR